MPEATDNKASGWRTYAALAAILAAALFLRLYGIGWGLPDAGHPTYSYHPDEALHIQWARWLAHGKVVPKHFMYGGTLYFHLLNAYAIFADYLGSLIDAYNALARVILVGRFFQVAIALLTMLTVYACGRKLYDERTAVLAALCIAVMPAHVIFVQSVRPDEVSALIGALLLLLAAAIWRAPPERVRRLAIIAGFGLGVTLAFRFTLVLLVAAPIAAYVIRMRGERPECRKYLVDGLGVGLCGLVSYLLVSPQTLLYPRIFLDGIHVQWLYQSTPFPDSASAGPLLLQHGWSMLHQAMGFPLYFLGMLALGCALARRTAPDWILLAGIVPYFMLTAIGTWVVVRYMLPLMPLLALLIARLIVAGWDAKQSWRHAIAGGVALVIGVTVLADVSYLRLAAAPDVRDTTAKWISEELPQKACFVDVQGYVGDQFFNPPISGKTCVASYRLQSAAAAELFSNHSFDYLILNEYLYKNMERLGAAHTQDAHRVFYEALSQSSYTVIASFKPKPEILGIDFSSWFSSHDYTYVYPGIRIYQRQ